MAEEGYPRPRIETPMPARVDHELAEDALKWMDAHAPGPPLMPYQRHAVRRMLETVDGELYWRRVLLLVARQQGKTYLMRRIMLWRQVEGTRIVGQPQHVMNLAPHYDLAERLLEPWAETLVERFGGRKRAKTHAYDYYLTGDETGPTWSARTLRRTHGHRQQHDLHVRRRGSGRAVRRRSPRPGPHDERQPCGAAADVLRGCRCGRRAVLGAVGGGAAAAGAA